MEAGKMAPPEAAVTRTAEQTLPLRVAFGYANPVSADPKSRRRKIGTVAIAIAILMLIAGETVLKSRLSGVPMLCYWLGCFAFTAIAAGAAVIDAARVGIEGRNAQKTLIEETLKEIEDKKRSDKQQPKK
jgi:hypothetical protein